MAGMIKTRKRRTTFSREQLVNMERTFQKHPYLTPTQRADLAKSLNLAQIQVQVRPSTWLRYKSRYVPQLGSDTSPGKFINLAQIQVQVRPSTWPRYKSR